MELRDTFLEAARKKAIALRSRRSEISEILDKVELPIYSKDQYKEYKFISTHPKHEATKIANSLKKVSPYITIHSFLFGNEQIISVDNQKVAYIYYCNLELDKIRSFNESKLRTIRILYAKKGMST